MITADSQVGQEGEHVATTTAAEAKQLVRRLVDDVMNGGDVDLLDELCDPRLAPKLRTAFAQFRSAFPDWHQEIVELVQEGSTVVARFRCSGTHRGPWQGLAATGRSMRIDEVYFFRVSDGGISGLWGLEDTWTRTRQLAGDAVTLGELGSLT
jgi:predicted ester cyclase